MIVLFVHQNFPGQYLHIARALAAAPENRVFAIGMSSTPRVQNVRYLRYAVDHAPRQGVHPFTAEVDSKIRRGEAVAACCASLRAEGVVPDVICAHPGWGEALFLKDIFPESRLLCFQEFYYSAVGSDMHFDPEYSNPDIRQHYRLRVKNVPLLASLEAADWNVCPTHWQCGQIPERYRSAITVLHDGIDTDVCAPNPAAEIRLQNLGLSLSARDEIITYVSRNLEPYRGFHMFMRALPEILSRRPKARVILAGGDGVSYGKRLPPGQSYRQLLLRELEGRLDLSRVHFVGKVPYAVYLALLQVSSAHVYLTYPFVLSWSMLEAMSAGCLLVASATQPVTEVLRHGENGLLFDFFDPKQLADTVVTAVENPERYAGLREAARREVIARYDLRTRCLPGHLEIIRNLAAGRIPPVSSSAFLP